MNIFFDVDDTLMNHHQAEMDGVVAFLNQKSPKHHVNVNEFLALWHSVAERYMDLYLKGDMSFQQQRRSRMKEIFWSYGRILSDSEADELFELYLKKYEQSWSLFPDVIPCLKSLSSHTLGIITNGSTVQQLQKLTDLGIEKYFEHVVISEDVGHSKPHLCIFNEACQRSASHSNNMYIGDRLETDALASSAAGMLGVWLNRKNDIQNTQGTHQISTLSEVPLLISEYDTLR